MPWKSGTVMDQKIEFIIRVRAKEQTLSELCREFEISRPTGYLWKKRYEQGGSLAALEEKSRRPKYSPLRTEDRLEERVVELRNRYGWGARKIETVMAGEGLQLPAITIHRILVRRGLVNVERPNRQATKRFERSECNEMLQMDFKGQYQMKGEKCYPLSLLDDHSRYAVGLWPLASPNGEGVYRSLRSRFRELGVPRSILTDHGTPWFSTTNGHGLTRLSVWMIKQGITLRFSGIRHPQTHGKVERFHRTLKDRTKHRGLPQTLEEWQRWASEFL